MRTDIRFVPLDKVGASAALAQALLDAHGAVLLPKDVRLTDAMLAALRRRGIDLIPLADAGPPDAELPAETATRAEQEKTRERLRHLFRHGGGTAADAAFMRLAMTYRLEKRK